MDRRSLIFVFALTIALFFINQWFGSKEDERRAAKHTEQVATIEQNKTVLTPAEEKRASPIVPGALGEQFYVLENDYQQLVFSNIGGALAEINLPFQSEKNPKSVVREIGFDRAMEKQCSSDDYFPLHSYSVMNAQGNVEKREQGELGGYYPLLRRSLKGPGVHPLYHAPARYYALNILSQEGETENLVYQVKRFEKDLIEFEAVQSHRRIVKTFSLPKDADSAPYCLNLSIRVEGDSRNLWITSGVPEVELISGSSSPSLQYRMQRGKKALVEEISLPKTTTNISSVYPEWVSNSNGFLGLILTPLSEIGSGFAASYVSGHDDPTRLSLIDAHYDLYPAEKYPGYEIQLPLRSSKEPIEMRIFAGPFEDQILKRIDATYTDPKTGKSPDYISSQTFHGWFSFISEPFAKFLFVLMNFFYWVTHSWGISIILLTVALRIMLYPLNGWSIKSTTRMQQIAPEVAALQAKYKKDPKRAQMEVMNLYRERKVNPLTGCFPILIQMPFLIGMFDLLKSTFALRGASFIPGWIPNLTAPDVVFSWGYPLPFLGSSFHLLPILLGVVMYLQQKMSSTLPKDKSQLTDQQKQQKMMGNIMAIVFTVMFYSFPSGLNIYWLSSMLLGILQQWMTSRKMRANRGKPEVLSR